MTENGTSTSYEVVATETTAPGYKVYPPDKLLEVYNSSEIADFLIEILSQTYNGRSDSPTGYDPHEIALQISEGHLLPFITFDGEIPIGSFAARWYPAEGIMDLVKVAVRPQYRAAFRGKQMYADADKWILEKMGSRVAVIFSGARLPVASAITFKHLNMFPYVLAPYASWGFPSQAFTGNERDQELLMLQEKYPQGTVYLPQHVYLPNDQITSQEIRNLLSFFAHFTPELDLSYELHDSVTSESIEPSVSVRWGDEEQLNIVCSTSDDSMNLMDLARTAFRLDGISSSTIPHSRLIIVEVPPETQKSSAIQNNLLQNGFVFCGFYPGVGPTQVKNQAGQEFSFHRTPALIYGALRPGIQLESPTVPSFDYENLQQIYEEIAQAWVSQELQS